jgi:hypothetical protein
VQHLSPTRWKTVAATAATAALAAGAFGLTAAASSPAQPEPVELQAGAQLGAEVDEPAGASTVRDHSPGSNDS